MKIFSTATSISHAFKNVGRVREIIQVFARHGFADLLYRMRLTGWFGTSKSRETEHLPIPVRLRMAFEQLGPSYVKLGQLLASRPDLIPEAFIEEFEKLQDNVGTVPFEEIQSVMETELGAPIDSVFESFDPVPMAAASIAQVHSGVLKTGDKVAVKIQRPGIARLIQNDISILRGLAELLEAYVPETRIANPKGLVEEFFRTILFETDFGVEANNIRRIRDNLKDLERITVPKVYLEHSTDKILILEKFEGVRFSDRERVLALGVDPMEIVEAGADAFFHMVMQDGLFHADLHAGNLFVLNNGKIGIIDFGIVGRLSRRVRDSIITMFTSLIEEDYESLAAEYLDLCTNKTTTDLVSFQKDLMDAISPYMGMRLGDVNAGRILLRSTSIAAKHDITVPRELLLLFKAIVSIEALGKRLEPDFDILQVGTRQARQIITHRYSKDRLMRDLVVVGRDVQLLAERLPTLARRFIRTWSQNGFAIETINPDTDRLQKALRQLTYHMVAATLSVLFVALGITFLVTAKGPEFLGLPLFGILLPLPAFALLSYGLWHLRKYR